MITLVQEASKQPRRHAVTMRRYLLALVVLMAPLGGACSHLPALRGFRDEGARPVTPAHFRAQRIRIEGGVGPDYYLAPQDRFSDVRPYAVIDIGGSNPVFSWRRFGPNWEDPSDTEKPFGWHDSTGAPMPEPLARMNVPRRDSVRMWAIQFSAPVAFHLLWDPLSANAPIINTDYEFGGEVAARAALTYRAELRGSFYIGHISTHIGDEYTLAAREDSRGTPFPRINVSYEPTRLALGIRRYGPLGDERYAKFPKWHVDVVGNLESSCIPGFCGTNPYYNVEPAENDGYPVPLTNERLEGSITVAGSITRRVRAHRPAETRIPGDFHFAVLAGAHNVFPYRPDMGLPAQPMLKGNYAPVVNAVLGMGFQRANIGTIPAAAYLRYYRGPNPYGQLRNQRDFSLLSIGLTLSR